MSSRTRSAAAAAASSKSKSVSSASSSSSPSSLRSSLRRDAPSDGNRNINYANNSNNNDTDRDPHVSHTYQSGAQQQQQQQQGIKFGTGIVYDDDAYGGGVGNGGHGVEYVTELADEENEDEDNENNDEEEDAITLDTGRMAAHPSTHASAHSLEDAPDLSLESTDPFARDYCKSRKSDYHARQYDRVVRETGLSFAETMQQVNMDKEKQELVRELQTVQEQQERLQEQTTTQVANGLSSAKEVVAEAKNGKSSNSSSGSGVGVGVRKRRWDDASSPSDREAPGTGTAAPMITTRETEAAPETETAIVSDTESRTSSRKAQWEQNDDTKISTRRKRWDETPVMASSSSLASVAYPVGVEDATPVASRSSFSKWDETPDIRLTSTTTTSGGPSKNRWDATPVSEPLPMTTSSGTPQTPLTAAGTLSRALALEKEMESRNRPWTEAALDAILPSEGYKILRPPASYIPLRTPGRKLLATPTPLSMTPAGFTMEIPIEQRQGASMQDIREAYGVPMVGTQMGGEGLEASNLPFIKPDDTQYFGRLLEDVNENQLSKDDLKERQIMFLLLKIKNGTPPQRKTAMRQITDKARSFGAGSLFHQILPLLMSPSLEDQERHWLVKVIDRVLYKLDDLVRPYVHRILAVIEPLLIDEDYYARIEGREIISNLAKAAGLATMIATMRPDIDSPDEYVRNTTSRAFAVVASALGVPALLPFLKAVCQSRKSWHARHTGIKIVQQIALLMGIAVLPFLRELVDIISHGLTDDVLKVKIITALTCAALAEAAHPYGIESFDSVIRPLWKGSMEQHGKPLAAFLKAIGFVIPLMEENYASHYTRLVMPILIREFKSPDEEMKRIVLKVVQQCVSTAGVDPDYIRSDILPEFFRNFWIRRMALDRRNYKQVVETTEELANKVRSSEIVLRIVDDLKDDSEPYRRMVMETIKKVLSNLGASDIDERLEERLIDGMLYAFQEQAVDATAAAGGASVHSHESAIMLDGFGTVVTTLGERCKPYLKQITGTIKWRLNNKSAPVRMQAADLVGRIAIVMKACGEDQLMGHLGVLLYEYLGEEFPEVLGSILGAIRSIVNVIGMTKMTPPIRDLLPRLTPILRNRHEKVQENVIDLVGRIADRGAEQVSAKEWLRICFELLEMIRAHKRAIRRAAVSTFGYVAKAIGPQDVLHTLLNNLKVQDRQMRVCTTVAIAIVAESCGPFTVLPALMNEYRVPELNIQNGVLKALSFVFEYIGDLGRDYIYAVTPLLQDALMERDPVHRQTACATVRHLALGVTGLGCEDALIHLLNYVWPNIFEESPHVIQAVFDAIQGLMVALGPNIIFQYTLQGLYHPARKVREVYWKLYNMLYIYHADALVLGYAMIPNDGGNTYVRTSLELFI